MLNLTLGQLVRFVLSLVPPLVESLLWNPVDQIVLFGEVHDAHTDLSSCRPHHVLLGNPLLSPPPLYGNTAYWASPTVTISESLHKFFNGVAESISASVQCGRDRLCSILRCEIGFVFTKLLSAQLGSAPLPFLGAVPRILLLDLVLVGFMSTWMGDSMLIVISTLHGVHPL